MIVVITIDFRGKVDINMENLKKNSGGGNDSRPER